jgi:hypothetical protein
MHVIGALACLLDIACAICLMQYKRQQDRASYRPGQHPGQFNDMISSAQCIERYRRRYNRIYSQFYVRLVIRSLQTIARPHAASLSLHCLSRLNWILMSLSAFVRAKLCLANPTFPPRTTDLELVSGTAVLRTAFSLNEETTVENPIVTC